MITVNKVEPSKAKTGIHFNDIDVGQAFTWSISKDQTI